MYPNLRNLFSTIPEFSNMSQSERSEQPDPQDQTVPLLSMTELFKFIPSFDGNRDDLSSFITKVGSAFSISIPNQRLILLKYVLNQISGKAGALVTNRKFENWRDLRDFLLLHYQDTKHRAQLLCELTNLQQKSNETVSIFAQRIETLLKRLTASISQDSPNTLLDGQLFLMNEIAISRFVHFTQPKISDRLRGSKHSNLNEALTVALAEEASLRMMQPTNSKIKVNSFEKRYCSYCKTNTHNTDKCYVQNKMKQSKILQIQTNSNSPPKFEPFKVCAYCKFKGHTI